MIWFYLRENNFYWNVTHLKFNEQGKVSHNEFGACIRETYTENYLAIFDYFTISLDWGRKSSQNKYGKLLDNHSIWIICSKFTNFTVQYNYDSCMLRERLNSDLYSNSFRDCNFIFLIWLPSQTVQISKEKLCFVIFNVFSKIFSQIQ